MKSIVVRLGVVTALVLWGCADSTDGPADAGNDILTDLPPRPDGPSDGAQPDAMPADGPVSDMYTGPQPVWFLHITDLHIGASSFTTQALTAAVNVLLPAVGPAATLVTGDVTDDGSTGQWSAYQAVVQGNVPSYPEYLEIIGNHDVQADDGKSFIAGAQTGKAGGGLHGLSYLDLPTGRVRIVRTNTVDHSAHVNQLLGYVGSGQVGALESLPPSAVSVKHSIVAGHHPLTGVQSLQVLGTDKRMDQILAHFSAEVYLCGHAHFPRLSWRKNTLVVQASTLGKPEALTPKPGFAVVALDATGPAVRAFGLTKSNPPVIDWPLVLVTTPADGALGGNNPNAKPIAPGQAVTVRAVVASPQGAQTVEARFDGETWAPMNALAKRLWQTELKAPAAAGERKIEVRALSPEGAGTHAVTVTIAP